MAARQRSKGASMPPDLMLIKFGEWRATCAKFAKKALGLDDLLAGDDPYDLFGMMAEAFYKSETPEAFVREAFAEDFAARAYDADLKRQSLEQ